MIPAYEPDDKLVALVDALANRFPVLVVDDGSTGAGCPAVFQRAGEAGAVVLHHRVNLGKGSALKTGIAYVQKLGPDVPGVVTADADGQHTPADIARIAEAMAAHPGAIILGARDFAKMPARSKTGNALTRLAFRAGTGLRVSDTQTGLRGLPQNLFSELLTLSGERYEYEMNMLLAIPAWEVPFHEVEIDTIYIDGNKSTHFNALRDGYRVFSRVVKYVGSSLASTLADYALYLILCSLGVSVALSFAVSKAASSFLNYELNCRTVFHARPSAANALAYATLVAFTLLAGMPAVYALTKLGVSQLLSKIIVDIVFFAFNYFMQKHVVFRKKRPKENGDPEA